MRKTPEILLPALRQYQHNYPTGELFAGFDYKETCKIVAGLEWEVTALGWMVTVKTNEIAGLKDRIVMLVLESFECSNNRLTNNPKGGDSNDTNATR